MGPWVCRPTSTGAAGPSHCTSIAQAAYLCFSGSPNGRQKLACLLGRPTYIRTARRVISSWPFGRLRALANPNYPMATWYDDHHHYWDWDDHGLSFCLPEALRLYEVSRKHTVASRHTPAVPHGAKQLREGCFRAGNGREINDPVPCIPSRKATASLSFFFFLVRHIRTGYTGHALFFLENGINTSTFSSRRMHGDDL
jgi:hypothetical protein